MQQSIDFSWDYDSLEQVERHVILDRLASCGNSQARTAASLKIALRTLNAKLAKWKAEEKEKGTSEHGSVE